jgi:hypothetical protein
MQLSAIKKIALSAGLALAIAAPAMAQSVKSAEVWVLMDTPALTNSVPQIAGWYPTKKDCKAAEPTLAAESYGSFRSCQKQDLFIPAPAGSGSTNLQSGNN